MSELIRVARSLDPEFHNPSPSYNNTRTQSSTNAFYNPRFGSLDLDTMLLVARSPDPERIRAASRVPFTAENLFASQMSSQACEIWDNPTVNSVCDVTSKMTAIYEECQNQLSQELKDQGSGGLGIHERRMKPFVKNKKAMSDSAQIWLLKIRPVTPTDDAAAARLEECKRTMGLMLKGKPLTEPVSTRTLPGAEATHRESRL